MEIETEGLVVVVGKGASVRVTYTRPPTEEEIEEREPGRAPCKNDITQVFVAATHDDTPVVEVSKTVTLV